MSKLISIPTQNILGLHVASDRHASRAAIAHALVSKDSPYPFSVYTPNSSILAKAALSKRYHRLLDHADLLLPDGFGVSLALSANAPKIYSRSTGIDTAVDILAFASRHGLSVFLLGGKVGIAESAAQKLTRRFPALKIAGTHHGYFTKHGRENDAVTDMIRHAAPDIIFVCLGSPLQEAWIAANRAKFPSARLIMGLGGSLDVWSGNVRRAPRAVSKIGLEWLWRVLIDPRKMREVPLLPMFLLLSAAQKAGQSIPRRRDHSSMS